MEIILLRWPVITQFGFPSTGYPHEEPTPVDPFYYRIKALIREIRPKPFLKVLLHLRPGKKCLREYYMTIWNNRTSTAFWVYNDGVAACSMHRRMPG
jgi:hypothetical protein